MYIILLLWAVLSFFGVISSTTIPSIFDVFGQLYSEAFVYLKHFYITIIPVVLGIFVSIFISLILICMLFSMNRYAVDKKFLAVIYSLQSIPSFLVMPILVIWFGHGVLSKVFIVAFWGVFTIVTVGYKAITAMPKSYQHLYGYSQKIPFFRHVLIPYLSPLLTKGIGVALAHAPLTILAAEIFGANEGLGYLMMLYYAQLDMAGVFSIVILVMLQLSFFNLGIKYVQKKYLPY